MERQDKAAPYMTKYSGHTQLNGIRRQPMTLRKHGMTAYNGDVGHYETERQGPALQYDVQRRHLTGARFYET